MISSSVCAASVRAKLLLHGVISDNAKATALVDDIVTTILDYIVANAEISVSIPGLQTTTTPGSPTGSPVAPVVLRIT